MGKPLAGMQRRRSRRFSARMHHVREQERQGLRSAVPPDPVEAHDPEHPTGCLRCFVARAQRPDLNERS